MGEGWFLDLRLTVSVEKSSSVATSAIGFDLVINSAFLGRKLCLLGGGGMTRGELNIMFVGPTEMSDAFTLPPPPSLESPIWLFSFIKTLKNKSNVGTYDIEETHSYINWACLGRPF